MLLSNIKNKLSGRFVSNMGWLGSAQVFVRIFRLGTTVVLARTFTPYDYGLVAIIYTVYGFVQVFTEDGGITTNIVVAKDKDLEEIVDTTYWIAWIICILVSLFQCLLAFPIAIFYDDRSIVLPICILSIVNLFIPFYKIHFGLIQRENRLKVIALGRTLQAVVLNSITICLALLGLGVWSVVLAMVFSAPVWIFVNRRGCAWRPPKRFTLKRWREVTSLGCNTLGVSFMDQIRLRLDYLLVGRFLGVDILGLYFFAFSAGLGISKQVIHAMSMALLPHLSASDSGIKQTESVFLDSLKSMAMILVPLVFLQSSLAPIYVPIVFGEQWASAVPILVIICISAIPQMFYTACYQFLLVLSESRLALMWNIVFTIVFAASLILIVKLGIFAVAITVAACHAVNAVVGFWLCRRSSKRLQMKGAG